MEGLSIRLVPFTLQKANKGKMKNGHGNGQDKAGRMQRMKRVLILEDNTAAAYSLEKAVKNLDANAEVTCVTQYTDACMMVTDRFFDLFIVDIILDKSYAHDTSGLEFISFLRNMKQYEFAPVIITTSLDSPKMHAYDKLHCYQYLEKPYDMKDVEKVIEKALRVPQRMDEDNYIYLKNEGYIWPQQINKIVYVYYKDRKVIVKSVDGINSFFYKSVSDIKNHLPGSHFFQCNRNTIINKKYIYKVDVIGNKIILKNEYGTFEIGKTFRKRVYEELTNG